jgi:hypothetical protein
VFDLGIAANFARELTEEQFAEPRRRPRRTTATVRAPRASVPGGMSAARRQDRTGGRGVRFGATRVGRTLARLAQVRG